MRSFLLMISVCFGQGSTQDLNLVTASIGCDSQPIKLGWKYSPDSAVMARASWTYKNGLLVLSYITSTGPPGNPGNDFVGRAGFYEDDTVNVGLLINNSNFRTDSDLYILSAVINSTLVQDDVNVTIFESDALIAPLLIVGVNTFNLSAHPATITVPESSSISVDLSHIPDFQPVHARILFTLDGKNEWCNGTSDFKCNIRLQWTNTKPDLEIHYYYGSCQYTYKITLKLDAGSTTQDSTASIPTITEYISPLPASDNLTIIIGVTVPVCVILIVVVILVILCCIKNTHTRGNAHADQYGMHNSHLDDENYMYRKDSGYQAPPRQIPSAVVTVQPPADQTYTQSGYLGAVSGDRY